jgi:adenosylcobinamide-GDP ribazoletransferase
MAQSEPSQRDRGQNFPARWLTQSIGAITFYTGIPIPQPWPMRFDGIAKFAPIVGLAIGGTVVGADRLLSITGMPTATRCGLLVGLWLLITGGLHLDGAMDAADGLAVPDQQRRLDVMADSRTGAFGVMIAIALLGLKTLCLIDLASMREFAILLAAGWSRWGQVVAIARYPYLRAEGKGAFHKANAHPATDWIFGFVSLILLFGISGWLMPQHWLSLLTLTISGIIIALLTGSWFNHQFGGHTGDTYGAIVEWTETLLLCLAVALQAIA